MSSGCKRGLSLVEIIIASVLVVMVLAVTLNVIGHSARSATQSENRILAALLAESLLEEVATHPYGESPPSNWTTDYSLAQPATMWLEGRPHKADFHVKFVYKNGSFVGNSGGDSDLVTIVVSWSDSVGESPSWGTVPDEFYTAPSGERDNQHLLVAYPVWR